MAPGLIEEGGSTVRTFITTLKDHPAVLVLALCNLALIAFMYFALYSAAGFRNELIRQSFEYQKQTAELLARCVLSDKRSGIIWHGNICPPQLQTKGNLP